MLLLACGPAELRGPASAVDIQARIDAPTASVHDEAAVRAVLGRGVAVGSAQGGGFQLTIVVANIERFGLPTGPGGGVCPDPDLATTAAVEAHYDTLQTALTEMHDADLSLTIDQGFTQDCQLSDASDAIAKWRFVAHHAIMGSSYTSQVSASVRLNEAQRAAATPEPYLIVSGAYASEATLEAGESGWALATSSARVNYDVECATDEPAERRATSGGALFSLDHAEQGVDAFIDVAHPGGSFGWSLSWTQDATGSKLELVGQDGRLACRAEGEVWPDVTVRCEGEGEAYAFAWPDIESRLACY